MHQQNILNYQRRMDERREQAFWLKAISALALAAFVYAVTTPGVLG